MSYPHGKTENPIERERELSSRRNKLSFVDLVSSIRVKRSQSSGDQLKEAQSINKSLLALGDVIREGRSSKRHRRWRRKSSAGGRWMVVGGLSSTGENSSWESENSCLQNWEKVRTG
ncbi:hypothetical protein LguiA_000144 [Lonicera macranthoides]